MSATAPFTPAVLTVEHPQWCTTSKCRPTPDWDADGTGFVNHVAHLPVADGLRVLVMQGETLSSQGELLEQAPVVIVVEGARQELTAAHAGRLADALTRTAVVAGGAR
jgi:hypothetical protein